MPEEGNIYSVRDNTRVNGVAGVGYVPGESRGPISHRVDITESPLGYVPYLGNALQLGQSAYDWTDGNRLSAGIGAGLVLLPAPIGRIIKRTKGAWAPYARKAIDAILDTGEKISPKLKNYLGSAVRSVEDDLGKIDVEGIRKSVRDYQMFRDLEKAPLVRGIEDDLPQYQNILNVSVRPATVRENLINRMKLTNSSSGYGKWGALNAGKEITLYPGAVNPGVLGHEFRHSIQKGFTGELAFDPDTGKKVLLSRMPLSGVTAENNLYDVSSMLKKYNPESNWHQRLTELDAELESARQLYHPNTSWKELMNANDDRLNNSLDYLRRQFHLSNNDEANYIMKTMYEHGYSGGGKLNEEKKSKLTKLVERINSTSKADFVKRLLDEKRAVLNNVDGTVSTHELSYVDDGAGNAVVYPEVQSSMYGLMRQPSSNAYDRAVERGDTLHMSVPDAELFTTGYKDYYPGFKDYSCGGRKFDGGGKYFRTSLENESPLMYDPMIPSVPDVPVPVRYEPLPHYGLYEYPTSTGMAMNYPVNVGYAAPSPGYGVAEPVAVPVSSGLDPVKDAARRIMAVENSKTNPEGGWNEKEQRWYPHRSHEGGADTIAYGIKLSNGTPEAQLALEQGYLTDEQATHFADTLAQRYYDAAKRVYDGKYGAGEWDKLSDWSQSILTDFSYNPGLGKYPKLMEGFHSGDMDTILSEYKRYSGGQELGRNKIIREELDTLGTEHPIFRAEGGRLFEMGGPGWLNAPFPTKNILRLLDPEERKTIMIDKALREREEERERVRIENKEKAKESARVHELENEARKSNEERRMSILNNALEFGTDPIYILRGYYDKNNVDTKDEFGIKEDRVVVGRPGIRYMKNDLGDKTLFVNYPSTDSVTVAPIYRSIILNKNGQLDTVYGPGTDRKLWDKIDESAKDIISETIRTYKNNPNSKTSSGNSIRFPFASGGKIHIAPSKRGTFTAAAKKHGKSVQAFAAQVLAHKGNYSPAMVKKANFARNAAKWHSEGGLLQRYSPEQILATISKLKK